MPRKYIILTILILGCYGCATSGSVGGHADSEHFPSDAVSETAPETEPLDSSAMTQPIPPPVIAVDPVVAPEDEPVPAPAESVEDAEAEAPPMGIVFLKTKFEGVVNAGYVILTLANIEDPETLYRIRIQSGEEPLKPFPWKTQMVAPGYISTELPPGEYQFLSITIPVGSAQATEDMLIDFEVLPDVVTYLGTLKVFGSKEKLKLGGVPLIKPGFEYTLEVLNEKDDALQEFPRRFPEGISMQVRPMRPASPSPQ